MATCRAIVKEVVGLGVEDADRKRTWLADAEESERRGAVETSRAIYGHALGVFPGKKGIWRRAAQLEKARGTPGTLDALLRKAVQYCPQVPRVGVGRLGGRCWCVGRVGCCLVCDGGVLGVCVWGGCSMAWRRAWRLGVVGTGVCGGGGGSGGGDAAPGAAALPAGVRARGGGVFGGGGAAA